MSHHQLPGESAGGRRADDAASCAEFLERIVYFLDNELDPADIGPVQAHLDACGRCLHTYDLQRTIKALIARSCTESAPDRLRQRVLYQIRGVNLEVRVRDL